MRRSTKQPRQWGLDIHPERSVKRRGARSLPLSDEQSREEEEEEEGETEKWESKKWGTGRKGRMEGEQGVKYDSGIREIWDRDEEGSFGPGALCTGTKAYLVLDWPPPFWYPPPPPFTTAALLPLLPLLPLFLFFFLFWLLQRRLPLLETPRLFFALLFRRRPRSVRAFLSCLGGTRCPVKGSAK